MRSLNLSETVPGESRDRSAAMVALPDSCRAGGFDLVAPEPLDHLPVLLEFLATRPFAATCPNFADAGPILCALAERPTRCVSFHAVPREARSTVAEAGDEPVSAALVGLPDDHPSAPDAVLTGAQVVSGPDPRGGCAPCATRSRAWTRPAPPGRPGRAWRAAGPRKVAPGRSETGRALVRKLLQLTRRGARARAEDGGGPARCL